MVIYSNTFRLKTVKVIAFDADDTLWVNEPFFVAAETELRAFLERYGTSEAITRTLITVQAENFRLMGYGAKGFILSMIETAIHLTDGTVSGTEIQQIIDRGKELLRYPIELLDGVEEVLAALSPEKTLMVLTKGDLLDQESKLARSGIGAYFQHVEIVSEKDPTTYERILARYGLRPEELLMIGNSLKSDILPVVQIGAQAIHIPYHVTAHHEQVKPEAESTGYLRMESIREVLSLL